MTKPTQIPRAEPGQVCPLHKADVSQVCHACPWWVRVRGKDPQSEAELDHWACAVGWLPALLIEGAGQARSTTAAVDAMRNEAAQANQVLQAMVMTAATTPPAHAARLVVDEAGQGGRPGLLGRIFRLGKG